MSSSRVQAELEVSSSQVSTPRVEFVKCIFELELELKLETGFEPSWTHCIESSFSQTNLNHTANYKFRVIPPIVKFSVSSSNKEVIKWRYNKFPDKKNIKLRVKSGGIGSFKQNLMQNWATWVDTSCGILYFQNLL